MPGSILFPLSVASLLLAAVPAVAHEPSGTFQNDLARGSEFLIVGNRVASPTIRPPAPLPTFETGSPASFQILGTTARPKTPPPDVHPPDTGKPAPVLDFTVVGPQKAAAPPAPVVFVYSAPDERACPACQRLRAEAADLPISFRWSSPPAWVRSYPTLHWQDSRGHWRQWAGWPGKDRFLEILKSTRKN